MIKHLRNFTCLVIILCFMSVNVPNVDAAEIFVPSMPKPGVMVNLSPAFMPAHISGMTIHPDDGLKFDFLIDRGQQEFNIDQKKEEYTKLVKYFLASLTIADKDQWVNLSPYESGRIIETNFGLTEMGRDLLAQDYLLKQITSSLMYPESGLGKKFWDHVYERAFKEFGNTNIPVNTINKVWIMPDDAAVYESNNSVIIVKAHLKVMLEEDYLAMNKNHISPPLVGGARGGVRSDDAPLPNPPHNGGGNMSQVIRAIILPELEKEVNEGKNFAQLRQIVSAMILATWYKQALKESILGKVYADRSKVKGVDQDPKANDAIYKQYLAAFKKGVYSYIKEDEDKYTHQIIPRKYFAGGFQPLQNLNVFNAQRPLPAGLSSDTAMTSFDSAQIVLNSSADAAMSDRVNERRARTLIESTVAKPRMNADQWFREVSRNNGKALAGIQWGVTKQIVTAPELAANSSRIPVSSSQGSAVSKQEKPIFPATDILPLPIGEASEIASNDPEEIAKVLANDLVLSPAGAATEKVIPSIPLQDTIGPIAIKAADYFEKVYHDANDQDIKGLYDGKQFYFGNDILALAKQLYPDEKNLTKSVFLVISRMRTGKDHLVPVQLSKDKFMFTVARITPKKLDSSSQREGVLIKGNNTQVDHLFKEVNDEFDARAVTVRKNLMAELEKLSGISEQYKNEIQKLTDEMSSLQEAGQVITTPSVQGEPKVRMDLTGRVLAKKKEIRELQARQSDLLTEVKHMKDKIQEQELAAKSLLEQQQAALEQKKRQRVKRLVQKGTQFIAKVFNWYMFKSIGQGIDQFSFTAIEKQVVKRQVVIQSQQDKKAIVPPIETGLNFWTKEVTGSAAQQKAIYNAVLLVEGAINFKMSERPVMFENHAISIDGFLRLSNQGIYFGQAQSRVDDIPFMIRRDAQGTKIVLKEQQDKIVYPLVRNYIESLNEALQQARTGVVSVAAVKWDNTQDTFDLKMPVGQPLFFNVSGTDFRAVEINGRMQIARASDDRQGFNILSENTQSLITTNGKPVKITFYSRTSNGQKFLVVKRTGGVIPEVLIFNPNLGLKKSLEINKPKSGDYLISMPKDQPLVFAISRKVYKAERSQTGEIQFSVIASDGISYERSTSSAAQLLIGEQVVNVDVADEVIGNSHYVRVKQLSGNVPITVVQYYDAGNWADSLKSAALMKAGSAAPYGGIDLNAANFGLQIKRDGRGVALPFSQQDMNLLGSIEGFVPTIIEIKPVLNLPILSELQEKARSSQMTASST